FEPIPYTQSLDERGARSMEASEAASFVRELLKRGEELRDSALMQSRWKALCALNRTDYLDMLFAPAPGLGRFQQLLRSFLHPRKAILQSLLLVQCETHREILETIFSDERSRG